MSAGDLHDLRVLRDFLADESRELSGRGRSGFAAELIKTRVHFLRPERLREGGVQLPFAGFVAAMAVMIAVCSLASGEFRAKEVIALIVVLCGLCWVIFVYLLGMTIPVFPVMVGE